MAADNIDKLAESRRLDIEPARCKYVIDKVFDGDNATQHGQTGVE